MGSSQLFPDLGRNGSFSCQWPDRLLIQGMDSPRRMQLLHLPQAPDDDARRIVEALLPIRENIAIRHLEVSFAALFYSPRPRFSAAMDCAFIMLLSASGERGRPAALCSNTQPRNSAGDIFSTSESVIARVLMKLT